MDAFEKLLALASAEDKKKARSYLKPGRIARLLAFALADDVTDLEIKTIANEFGVEPDTVRNWFEKEKAKGRFRPKSLR